MRIAKSVVKAPMAMVLTHLARADLWELNVGFYASGQSLVAYVVVKYPVVQVSASLGEGSWGSRTTI